MSTNKRKEAAALFELIDKSSLKVPKNAGALKIPNWWSSKTNPPTSSPTPTTGAPGSLVSRISESPTPRSIPQSRITPPTPPASSPSPSGAPAAPSVRTPESTPEPTPQHRLFDPPPANATPTATPSIRPPTPPTQTPIYTSASAKAPPSAAPSAPITSAFASKSPPPAPASNSIKTTQPEPDFADDLPLPEPTDSFPRRTFAPNTHALSGKPWSPQSGRAFARLPTWAKLSALAVVIILFAGIIELALSLSSGKTTPTSAVNSGSGILNNGSAAQPAGTPNMGAPSMAPPPPSNPSRNMNATPTPPAPHNTSSGSPNPPSIIPQPAQGTNSPLPPGDYVGTGGGRAFKPGVLGSIRNYKFYYIIICTTPSTTIAERNAVLLADHGIDVSIELKPSSNGSNLYQLISAQGFATSQSAEPLLRKVVAIGHLVPEYKKTQRGWDDAYPAHLKNP